MEYTKTRYKKRKTIEKTFDPDHYAKGTMASSVYGDEEYKIKKRKKVTKYDRKGNIKKIKEIEYSPISYYGKQTKTKKVTRPQDTV